MARALPARVVVGTAFTTNCANASGNNLSIDIPADDDYTFTFDATGADKLRPKIKVAKFVPGGGGGTPPPTDSAAIRVFGASVTPGSAEVLITTIKGSGTLAVDAKAATPNDPRITRIEIENLGANGDVGIADFTWTAYARFAPAAQPVDIYYHKPSGGYASTTITIAGKSYPCAATTDSAYGCVAKGVPLYPYQNVSMTVSGSSETIQFNADTATQPIYTSEGAYLGRLGAPGEPTKAAAVPRNANEVILFYKRADGKYTGWGVHLFPKDPAGADWTTWAAPYAYEGIDPQYGAYFRITLPPNAGYSANPAALATFPNVLGFIIHNGDEKDPGPDQEVRIAEDGNMVYVVSGVADVGSSPPVASVVRPVDYAAHWVTKDTVLYKPATYVTNVELLWSPDASLTSNATGGFSGNFATVPLSTGTNPKIDYLQDLWSLPGYSLPSAAINDAKAIARSQIYVVGKDANGVIKAVTRAQINGALDDLYATAARDVALGPTYSGGVPSLKVWAPTALLNPGVSVQLYNADGSAHGDPAPMTLDPATGVWSVTGDASWDRLFYTYTLKVYSNYGDTLVTNTVSDPYAVSGATQGDFSQIVNLDDPDLKPAGWDTLAKPALAAPEDIVLYELHVRDFSIVDATVPAADRGKYTAFDIAGTNGRQHLQQLAAAGLTHVHILPAFDTDSVLENPADRVDIDDPVQRLCDTVPAAASLCFNPANGSKTIRQLLTELTASGPAALDQQQIISWMSGYDGFNWGYDPFHYGSPEGSYSTDPNGVKRILEFRRMVKGLSSLGLRTVMDVVYNHTIQSGMGIASVFDKIVPGYYHRRDIKTGDVQNKQCCNDVATEWKMTEKVMFDTALRWVKDYKVDGFRFDIMAGHTLDQMQRLLQAAKDASGDPNFYIYGEGWNSGGGENDKRYKSARQDNLGGTGIGSFNDRIRDPIRGGGPFDSGASLIAQQGVANGLWYDPNSANSGSSAEKTELVQSTDQIREAMAGGLKSYSFENYQGQIVAGSTVGGYTNDPQELINYIESHDNETFWDVSQYRHPAGTPTAARVRAHNVGLSMVLLAQGVPFIQAGEDILRSKSTDKNSYNSGDWFNEIDWTLATSNWAIGLPPQGDNGSNKAQATSVLLDPTAASSASDRQFAFNVTKEWLEIRKSSQLFRLRTADQIRGRMTMLNTGASQQAGVIAYRLDGCSSPELTQQPYGAVVAIFNPTKSWSQLAIFKDEGFVLHPVLANSVDATVKTATFDSTNGFRVPPRTTAVFVKNAQTSCSPYGVPIFVRGLGADWTANPARELQYVGGTSYLRTINVAAGAQQFKIADNDWTGASNCGAAVDGVTVQVAKSTVLLCDNNSKNLGFTPPAAGDYTFSLDAANKVNPVLVVGKAAPFGSTTLYVRGGFNDWGNGGGGAPKYPMAWDGLSKYRAEVLNLPAQSFEFKIADADWTGATTCGAGAGGNTVTVGTPYTLFCSGSSGNLSIAFPSAGSYLFAIDGSNPAALQLTVEQMPFAVALYIRGTLNDSWANPPPASNRLSYLGGGIYKSTQGTVAGAYQFKIADAGWTDGTNCGASTAATIGTPLTLKCVGPGNDNIGFTVPSTGFYDFSLNATTPTAPTLTVTGP